MKLTLSCILVIVLISYSSGQVSVNCQYRPMGVDHGEIEHSLRGSSHCSRTVWFDKGSVVFLNFTQIIVGNPDSCDKNFIKVHDGLNAKGPLLSEYCKSQSSSTLTSKSNNVYIISKSGSSSAVSFHARYRVVTKPAVKRRPSSKPGPENEHTTLIVPVTKVKQRPSSRPGHENKHTTLIVPLTKAKVKQRPSSRPGHENKHTTLTVPLTKAKGEADVLKDAVNILSAMKKLPGKPFHKCCKRLEEIKGMTSLYESISNPKGTLVTTVYLTGPPGSGKTQLARQFGENFLESTPSFENYPPLVLTLNAESTKSLLSSMEELVDKLELKKSQRITKDCDEVNLVRSYVDDLRKLLEKYPGEWLLILDNMFRNEEINKILPKPGSEDWGKGKVLITSQDSEIVPACHEYARNYSLRNGMDETNALNLLQNVSGIDVDEHAVQVAKDLEYFPLALACSATYVGQMIKDRPGTNFSWKDFLDLHRSQKEKLTYRTYAAFNVYPCSMTVAAWLAANRLAKYSNVLRHTFCFLSYCTLDPVPLAVISKYVKDRLLSNDMPSDVCKDVPSDEIKAEICRCSLLVSDSSDSSCLETVRFHQVMGEAFKYIREEPMYSGKGVGRRRYVLMLKSLEKSLGEVIPKYDRASVALKVFVSPHMKSIVNYGKSRSWCTSSEFVILLAFLADSLYHVPGVTEFERILYAELAYRTAQGLSEPMKSIRYCRVLHTLGFYYREANRLHESVVVLLEALVLTETKSGDDWIALRSSLLNVLSWTYKLQMKLDLAEQKMKESIELAKHVFGEEHEEIVERLCNFAIIFREKCQMQKAKEMVDEARRIAEIAISERHLTRAQAANFSAKIYLRCAEIDENLERRHALLRTSRELHSQALNIYENVLGKNHIFVAGVSMTYAMVCKELKQYEQALKQVERAVKIYKEVEHVQLSAALRYQAEVLLAMPNASVEAELAIKESIELSDCGRARFLLAHTYLKQKRFKEARSIFKQVLTRWKSGVLPATHFWVKHAEKLKAECDWELLKIYVPKILAIAVLTIAICAGIFLQYQI